MATSYQWVIVAVGGTMGCVAAGAMFSLAVFLEPIVSTTGWSHAGVSLAMTLNFIVMGIGGFMWGMASDRFGARIVTLIGSVLLGLALVLGSAATSLPAFQLVYGGMLGLATSAFFAPMIALTMAWFDKHRSIAVSLVSAGIGIAPMTISPLARFLVTYYGDWRPAMLAIGIGCWIILPPLALLMRPAPKGTAEQTAATADTAQGGEDWSLGAIIRSPKFLVLGCTYFACCAAHSGPIFHMVSYAMTCGIAPMAAVSIYSVEGAAGLGGRVLLGLLGDRFGAKPVLIGGLLVQALVISAYTQASSLPGFYALAIIFGAAYGGVMPLYAVLAHDYFPPHLMGTVLGGITLLSSAGMALGPVAGGWAFDHFAGYEWMFIGSSLMGLAAVAIALAFPKPNGAQPPGVAAAA
ncbi:MFS transporter [Neorhizobium sp. NPDC001467]|uniref:MFS transporter n=1 Tax=Neorhizobium sp. NPDC001467 TaxID=3390595 RepID=UPI003D00C702